MVPWEEISKPKSKNSLNSRRVDKNFKNNFFWVKDCDGNCGLLLNTKHTINKLKSFPKLKRLKFSIVKDNKSFVMFAHDEVNLKKFYALCKDLIQTCEIKGGENLIDEIRDSLKKWIKVFDSENKKMSASAQLGLFGELFFIKNTLSNFLDLESAILSWQGPRNHPQDFSYGKHLFEIKSKLNSSKPVIKISSLSQLDKFKSELFLFCKIFSISSENEAMSLDDICNQLMKNINNNYIRDYFITNLLLVGYNPDEKHYPQKYKLNDELIYEITEGFPKLIKKNVHSAIIDASYTINIQKLDNWILDNNLFYKKVFQNDRK